MGLQPGFVDDEGTGGSDTSSPIGVQTSEAPDGPPSMGPTLFEADDVMPPGRIDPFWNPAVLRTRRARAGSLWWIAAGLTLLLVSWVIISAAAFVVDQFGRSTVLGCIAVVLVGVSAVLILYGIYIEAIAFWRLQQVDSLRRELARADLKISEIRGICSRWLVIVSHSLPDSSCILAALDSLEAVPEAKSYMQHNVARPLREMAQQTGRRAALEGGAVIAVTPSPALDGLFAALRSLMLMREIAQMYGLRPGMLTTVALFRRVAWTAAGVSGLELLSRSLADHTLQKLPLVSHLAGAVPGTSAAAIRIYRLATITAEACSPLPDR